MTQAENLENLLNKYDQKIDIVLKFSVSLGQLKKDPERWSQEKERWIIQRLSDKRYQNYEAPRTSFRLLQAINKFS